MNVNELLGEAIDKLKTIYFEEKKKTMLVNSIEVFDNYTVVLGNNNEIGVCYNYNNEKGITAFAEIIKEYIGKPMIKLAEDLYKNINKFYKSFGIAAINALCDPIVNISRYYNKRFTLGDKVGHYVNYEDRVTVLDVNTYSKRFRDRCKVLRVVALNNEDIKYYIEKTDVVIIPGKTIVDNSLIDILKAGENARVRGIYDISAQMLPEVFFDIGINHINIIKIKNSLEFIKELKEGMEFEKALILNSLCYYLYNE